MKMQVLKMTSEKPLKTVTLVKITDKDILLIEPDKIIAETKTVIKPVEYIETEIFVNLPESNVCNYTYIRFSLRLYKF